MSSPRAPAVLPLVAMLAAAACATADHAPIIEATQEQREKVTVLGPSDVIEVRVFGEQELSGEHQIGADGTVRLPLVGSLKLEGLSPQDAQLLIERSYNEAYLKDAQVSVLVKKFNSRRIYVLGQVKSPGNYEYEPRMTVIGAIAKAGGLTRLSDANRTVITRGKANEQIRMAAEVNDIQRGQEPDIELLPGDIVFVPETLF